MAAMITSHIAHNIIIHVHTTNMITWHTIMWHNMTFKQLHTAYNYIEQIINTETGAEPNQ